MRILQCLARGAATIHSVNFHFGVLRSWGPLLQAGHFKQTVEHSRLALSGLVENARFARVKVNQGYVRALGLAAPSGATP